MPKDEKKEIKTLGMKFENCFGIKALSCKFDFNVQTTGKKTGSVSPATRFVHIIYAPNGMMKTSFANTLHLFSLGRDSEIQDVIDPTLKSSFQIDLNGVEPKREWIYRTDTEENSAESFEKVSNFLADKKNKEEYEKIIKILDEKKNEFIKKFKNVSGSSDCEAELVSTFCDNVNAKSEPDLYDVLETLNQEKNDEPEDVKYKGAPFKFNVVFDKVGKVKSFVEQNRNLLKNYFECYIKLLEKSDFFSHDRVKSFGPYQADLLDKSLSDDSYFRAAHQLKTKNGEEISSLKQYQNLIRTEKEKIISDKTLKANFEKINQKIDKNRELREFKDLIERRPDIIDPLLKDYDLFKKHVLLAYITNLSTDFDDLFSLYLSKKNDLQRIINAAQQKFGEWKEIISIFNERFALPFTVDLQNTEEIILKGAVPKLIFKYNTYKDSSKEIEKDKLLKILSRGEKRAYFILQLLFEIYSRQAASKDSFNLLVLDDVVDSFDYKNKYAFIEYLLDITENEGNNLYFILLTHNFDFYRNLKSRMGLARANCHLVKRNQDGTLELTQGNFLNDYFLCLKEKMERRVDKVQLPEFIALIPFFRNLSEYKLFAAAGNQETSETLYNFLTNCLHIKENTKAITLEMVQKEISSYFTALPAELTFQDYRPECRYFDSLLKVAEKSNQVILNEPETLVHKIILSISCRLMLEDILLSSLDKDTLSKLDCSKNQTRALVQAYLEKTKLRDPDQSAELRKLCREVVLLSSENIHLNSFMYEPLLDTDPIHLSQLYETLKRKHDLIDSNSRINGKSCTKIIDPY